jgi:hypothetical protein
MSRLGKLFSQYLYLKRLLLWLSGVGLGALLVAGGIFSTSQTSEMAGWQAVEATVDRSGTKLYDPLFLLPGEKRDVPVYQLDLLYSFSEGKMDWVGNRVRWQPEKYESESEAQSAAAQYRPGDTITVFYNPKDPRESVIDPSGDDMDSPLTLIGAVIFVGSLILLIVEFINGFQRRPRPVRDEFESHRPELNR